MDKCRYPLTKGEILKTKFRLFWKYPKTIFMSKEKRNDFTRNLFKERQEEAKKQHELEMKNLEKWIKYRECVEARGILLKKGLRICPKPPQGEEPENLDGIIKILKEDGTWDTDIKKILDQYKVLNLKDITTGNEYSLEI